MHRTERLLALVLLLQARGKLTGEQLAALLGVSVRTVYRDMDALSLAHVPVSMDYGPGGGYFLPERYRLNAGAFSDPEMHALALGAALLQGSPLLEGDGLRRALLKLEAILPEDAREHLRAVSESVILDQSGWHRPPATNEQLGALQSAIWNRRRVDLLYRRSDRPAAEWRRVEPLGLICKGDRWYLAAYCLTRRDYRTFRVDRIAELTLPDEASDPHPDFELRAYWQDARARFEARTRPLRLVLRLTPHGAFGLPETARRIAREPDGRVVVEVESDHADAAVAYVLSLGAEAEVLSPDEVRAGVAAAAAMVAAIYR